MMALKLKQINHQPVFLHLCIEMPHNEIQKLQTKLCEGKGTTEGRCHFYFIHLGFLDKCIFMFHLNNIKINKIKFFNLFPQG